MRINTNLNEVLIKNTYTNLDKDIIIDLTKEDISFNCRLFQYLNLKIEDGKLSLKMYPGYIPNSLFHYFKNFLEEDYLLTSITLKLTKDMKHKLLFLFNIFNLCQFERYDTEKQEIIKNDLLAIMFITSISNEYLSDSKKYGNEIVLNRTLVSIRDLMFSYKEFSLLDYASLPNFKFRIDDLPEEMKSEKEFKQLELNINNLLTTSKVKEYINIHDKHIKLTHVSFDIFRSLFDEKDVVSIIGDKLYDFLYTPSYIRQSLLYISLLIAPIKNNELINPYHTIIILNLIRGNFIETSNKTKDHIHFDSTSYSIFHDFSKNFLSNENIESFIKNNRTSLVGEIDGDDNLFSLDSNNPYDGLYNLVGYLNKILSYERIFYNNIPSIIKPVWNISDKLFNKLCDMVNIYTEIMNILPLSLVSTNLRLNHKYNYNQTSFDFNNKYDPTSSITSLLAHYKINIKGKSIFTFEELENKMVVLKGSEIDDTLNSIIDMNHLGSILSKYNRDTDVYKLFLLFKNDEYNKHFKTFDYKTLLLIVELFLNDLIPELSYFDRTINRYRIIAKIYCTLGVECKLVQKYDMYQRNSNVISDRSEFLTFAPQNNTTTLYDDNKTEYEYVLLDDLSYYQFLNGFKLYGLQSFNCIIRNNLIFGDYHHILNYELKNKMSDLKNINLVNYKREDRDLDDSLVRLLNQCFTRKSISNSTFTTNLYNLHLSNDSSEDLVYTFNSRPIIRSYFYDLSNTFFPQIDLNEFKIFEIMNQYIEDKYMDNDSIMYPELGNILNKYNINLNDFKQRGKIINYLNNNMNSDKDSLLKLIDDMGYFDIEFKRIVDNNGKMNLNNRLSSESNRIRGMAQSILSFINTNKEDSNLSINQLNIILSVIINISTYDNINDINKILFKVYYSNLRSSFKTMLTRLSRTGLFTMDRLLRILINTILIYKEDSIKRLDNIFSQRELQSIILHKSSSTNGLNYFIVDTLLTENIVNNPIDEFLNEDLLIKRARDIGKNYENNILGDNYLDIYFKGLEFLISDDVYNHKILIYSTLIHSLTFSEFTRLISESSFENIHNIIEPILKVFNYEYYSKMIYISNINDYMKFKRFYEDDFKNIAEESVGVYKIKKGENINKTLNFIKIIADLIQDKLISNKNYNLNNYNIILNHLESIYNENRNMLIDKMNSLPFKDFLYFIEHIYHSDKLYYKFLGLNASELMEKKLELRDYVDGVYKVHFHKSDDTICIKLGDITNCCQTITSTAHSCVKEGLMNPYSGFISIQKEGKIIAQSWVWLDKINNILVLDSVESRYVDEITKFTHLLNEWSKLQKYRIAIGSSYTKIDKKILSDNGWIYQYISNNKFDINSISEDKFRELILDIKECGNYYSNILKERESNMVNHINEDIDIKELITLVYGKKLINTLRLTCKTDSIYSDATSLVYLNKKGDDLK